MISDILSDAAADIRKTLDDPIYQQTYKDTRERIKKLVEEMDSVRVVLDTSAVELSPVVKAFKNASVNQPKPSAAHIALSRPPVPPVVEPEPRQPGFDKLSGK